MVLLAETDAIAAHGLLGVFCGVGLGTRVVWHREEESRGAMDATPKLTDTIKESGRLLGV